MKYIVALIILALGALAAFMLYQSRISRPDTELSSPAAPGQPHAGAIAGTHAGKVLETMDAGGYTYVHVDTGDEKVWAAAPQTQVKVGDVVAFKAGMQMTDFRSETLDRTFESIYFVSAINQGTASGLSPHARVSDASVEAMDFSRIEVPRGGKSIATVYGEKDRLAGKEVIVRGHVVKFTPGVMNKNWLHLRDGSGSEGTNDLTVTTDATVAVGDIVMARGKLGVDRDFGAGYSYQIILEDAVVTAERSQ